MTASFAAFETRQTAIRRGDRCALIRCGRSTDIGSIARLLERIFFPGRPQSAGQRRARRARIRSVAVLLRRPRTVFHVAELDGRICAASCYQIRSGFRVTSSNIAVSALGRSFDPRLVLRLAEHFVGCCRAEQWPRLRLFANFENERAAMIFALHFRRQGIDAAAPELRMRWRERLLLGSHRHLIDIDLRERAS
ncbi:hypothetical protein [Rhodopseudomonas palustris]|uniref:N-acetyltransferase domain-containing protein n=1 Tax=Rhodopseudomonas palustris (strain BisB18) TaxID=316056 RepID=Q216U8_RHOPB